MPNTLLFVLIFTNLMILIEIIITKMLLLSLIRRLNLVLSRKICSVKYIFCVLYQDLTLLRLHDYVLILPCTQNLKK